MNVTTFMNKSDRDVVMAAAKAEMAAVAAKYGLEMTPKTTKYMAEKMTVSFELNVKPADGVSVAQAEWNKWAELLGMKAEWFGKTITLNGTRFVIVGCIPNRPKNCVKIARTSDSKGFICPPAQVIRQLSVAA